MTRPVMPRTVAVFGLIRRRAAVGSVQFHQCVSGQWRGSALRRGVSGDWVHVYGRTIIVCAQRLLRALRLAERAAGGGRG
jgi:hypothetical protein